MPKLQTISRSRWPAGEQVQRSKRSKPFGNSHRFYVPLHINQATGNTYRFDNIETSGLTSFLPKPLKPLRHSCARYLVVSVGREIDIWIASAVPISDQKTPRTTCCFPQGAPRPSAEPPHAWTCLHVPHSRPARGCGVRHQAASTESMPKGSVSCGTDKEKSPSRRPPFTRPNLWGHTSKCHHAAPSPARGSIRNSTNAPSRAAGCARVSREL